MKAKRLYILNLFVLLAQFCSAQGFSVDDTLKTIYKPTNSSTPPHEYFQLYNNSGHAINMRWKVNTDFTFYPSAWQIAIQDNQTYHNPAPDSADFLLPDTVGAMDKIIINVYHNAVAGYGVFAVDLINLDSTDQVITIWFEIMIYEPSGIDESNAINIKVFPNPCSSFLYFEGLESGNKNTSINIIGLDGRVIQTNSNVLLNQNNLDISALLPGIYFIEIFNENQQRIYYSKVVKQ